MSLLTALALLLGLGGCALIGGGHESLGEENLTLVPKWVAREHLPKSAIPGAQIFAQAGCLNCHIYLGDGSRNLGAPDLSAEGARHRGRKFQIDFLTCPSCVHASSPMPSFSSLGRANLTKVAIFLEASKGSR